MAEVEHVLTMNGRKLAFTPGQTLLDVAGANGIDIPTLCHLPRCQPTGACRICVVEVKGARNLMTSCTMPAEPGLEVRTESDRVIRSRRMDIQLLLDMGRHDCLTCEANGDCRLQDLAYRYRVEPGRFQRPEEHYPIEDSNPMIVRDFTKCILCGRCVQACNEVQVNEAISFGYRGTEAKIVASGDRPLEKSDCVFCGECVQACPVGSLIEKKAIGRGRPWELTRTRTTCTYCGVGCQIHLQVKDDRVIRVTGVEDAAPNYGSLCVKGRFGFEFIDSPDRLTTPLIKKGRRFYPAGWEEALDLTVSRWKEFILESGPDSLAGLASARATNEENYVMQKLVRAGFGTNNIDHCARL